MVLARRASAVMACVMWLQVLAFAAPACWCTSAAAWKLFSRSSEEAQDEGNTHSRWQRPPWLETYDDQDVDPIPSNTIDFEYTTTRNAEPFFPDSEIHVVDVAPLQETFTGIHASENELFRTKSPGVKQIFIFDRIVSGLAVDKAGRQRQVEFIESASEAAPVVASNTLYSNPAMSLQDWENPVMWRNILELGIIRLTPACIETVSKPLTLLLNQHEYNAARVTAFVRLGSQSAGGVLLRAKSLTDYTAAILDTEKRIARLELCKGGTISTISEAPVLYVNPSIRHQITVNDTGAAGLVEMLVQGRVVISHQMPWTDEGRFGVKVSRGGALFDNFVIERCR